MLWALVARAPMSWLLGAAALLSKESAIIWPILAALRDRRWSWKERGPELVIVALSLLARQLVLGTAIAHVTSASPLVGLVGTLHLLGLFLVPWLDVRMYVAPLDLVALAPGAALGLLTAGLVAWRVRAVPGERWWAGAVLAALAPSAAVLTLNQVHGARLLYLPSAFLCLIVGAAIARPERWVRSTAFVIAVVFVVATCLGARAWRSEQTFLEVVARRGPPEALINLAAAQHDDGELLAAWKTLDRAEEKRRLPESAYLRGLVLAEVGCAAEAARALTRAIELRGRYPEAWTNLASLLRTSGRPQGAVEVVRAARAQGIDSPALQRIEDKARAAGGPERALASCSVPLPVLLADPVLLERAALARGREGEPRQGLVVIQAALRLRRDWPDALVTKASSTTSRASTPRPWTPPSAPCASRPPRCVR